MIYTSYFGALKNSLDSETMTAISIARRSPLQFRGHSFFDLAPPTSLIRQYKSGQINDDEYLVVYNKILNSLNPHDVYQRLLDMAKNTIPVLCCYEKPNDFCHRHYVADWFMRHGLECRELEKPIEKPSLFMQQLSLF